MKPDDLDRLLMQILLMLISIVGISRFKKLTEPYQLCAILLIATFIVEGINWILAVTIRNNLIMTHIFTPIEFALVAMIYSKELVNNTVKRVIIISIPLFAILSVLNTIFLQNIWTFATNTLLLDLAAYLIFSLLAFTQMLIYADNKGIAQTPLFWLSTGFLFYSSTIFLKFGLTNYLLSRNVHSALFDAIVQVANYILYILITVAIIIDSNEKRSRALQR